MILASREWPAKTDYEVIAVTKSAGIAGIGLAVLPSGEEPNFGPGRSREDGDFARGELALKVGEFGADVAPTAAKISGTVADYSRKDFEIQKAIDGKKDDDNNGWAISPNYGVPHFAALTLVQPLGNVEKGVRLRFELNQSHSGGFAIARFRLWVTTGAASLQVGYPHQRRQSRALRLLERQRSRTLQAPPHRCEPPFSTPARSRPRPTPRRHPQPRRPAPHRPKARPPPSARRTNQSPTREPPPHQRSRLRVGADQHAGSLVLC